MKSKTIGILMLVAAAIMLLSFVAYMGGWVAVAAFAGVFTFIALVFCGAALIR